ncbi:NUDIX domain-containing protein [Pedococcus dokdonensis]|uniref:NUDIX domain-containing protein n=1 Tax=Pedococcus dokdonensis TaxID=443156 RepID=UPI000B829B25|nr:NUDIX hydrolase [Pedococcus dokdonensis]
MPLTTRIAVHVLGVDPDRRVLLDRARPPLEPVWGLPGALVEPGEDPVVRARQLVSDAGALTATRVEVIDLESLVEDGLHVVHMVFECGAEPSLFPTDAGSTALWWTLPEIVGLRLSARTRKALASRWAWIWPDT